jgi:hypothetical protein
MSKERRAAGAVDSPPAGVRPLVPPCGLCYLAGTAVAEGGILDGVSEEASEVWVLCRVPKPEVCYLRYTLEAYEGLCIPTTLPGQGGVVRLLTSRESREALEATLHALSEELELEVLAWGEGALP